MRLRAGIGLLLACFQPSALLAQDTAQANGSASATVVRLLSASPLADLAFGGIMVGPLQGGEVTVSAAGATVYTGSVQSGCDGASDCTSHPAAFAVSGEPGRTYRISLPADVQARGARSGTLLPVSALLASSRNAPGAANRGRLDVRGEDEFAVGGTLTVPAAATPDTYRADLPVFVTYD